MLALALVLQAAAPSAAPAPVTTGRSFVRMSPQGRAIAGRAMRELLSRIPLDAERILAAQEAVERATATRPVDVAAVRRAVEARDDLESARARHQSAWALTLLHALPPADRPYLVDDLTFIADGTLQKVWNTAARNRNQRQE